MNGTWKETTDETVAHLNHQHACNTFTFEKKGFKDAADDFHECPSAENRRALERQMFVFQEAFNVRNHTRSTIQGFEAG